MPAAFHLQRINRTRGKMNPQSAFIFGVVFHQFAQAPLERVNLLAIFGYTYHRQWLCFICHPARIISEFSKDRIEFIARRSLNLIGIVLYAINLLQHIR